MCGDSGVTGEEKFVLTEDMTSELISLRERHKERSIKEQAFKQKRNRILIILALAASLPALLVTTFERYVSNFKSGTTKQQTQPNQNRQGIDHVEKAS